MQLQMKMMVRIKLAKNTLDHKNLKDSYDNDEENENIAKNFLVHV